MTGRVSEKAILVTAAGQGIAVLRGRMIESLHADAARRLIALADALAQR